MKSAAHARSQNGGRTSALLALDEIRTAVTDRQPHAEIEILVSRLTECLATLLTSSPANNSPVNGSMLSPGQGGDGGRPWTETGESVCPLSAGSDRAIDETGSVGG